MSAAHDRASAELLRQAVAGDAAALGRLLHCYRPLLHEVARHALAGSGHLGIDPSDVVQDALLYVARSIARFRGATLPEFEAWLRLAASNRAIDRVRIETAQVRDANRRQPLGEDDRLDPHGVHTLIGKEISPRTQAIERERLEAALQSIGAENQAVVRLYLKEVPVVEIAGRLALPLADAVQRLERGLRTLKRRLCDALQASSDDIDHAAD